MFLKEVSYAHQGYFYLINTVKTNYEILQFKITVSFLKNDMYTDRHYGICLYLNINVFIYKFLVSSFRNHSNMLIW